jgi:hypothetical protein
MPPSRGYASQARGNTFGFQNLPQSCSTGGRKSEIDFVGTEVGSKLAKTTSLTMRPQGELIKVKNEQRTGFRRLQKRVVRGADMRMYEIRDALVRRERSADVWSLAGSRPGRRGLRRCLVVRAKFGKVGGKAGKVVGPARRFSAPHKRPFLGAAGAGSLLRRSG